MSMKYIRERYGVPAKKGGRVRYTGGDKPIEGTITSTDGPHLRIRLDGNRWVDYFHPVWELEYLATEPEGDTE